MLPDFDAVDTPAALSLFSASSVLFKLTKYFGVAEIRAFLFKVIRKEEVDEVFSREVCPIQTVSQLSVSKKEGHRLTLTWMLKKQMLIKVLDEWFCLTGIIWGVILVYVIA